MTRRRGAFDIGSGATKLQVSDVSIDGLIIRTLYGEERPCAFGSDWLKSTDGCLSPLIQDKGIQTIKDLKAIGDELAVESYAVIATEVFRKAANGHLFLDKVRAMGMSVTVISQEIEAELGYATAVAYNGNHDLGACIAWDSGGGSFQISTLVETEDVVGECDASSGRTVDLGSQKKKYLEIYMGALGSSIATKTLIEELQGKKLADVLTPNPISDADANSLIEALILKMDEDVPIWLRNSPEVVAIGGPNSIFQLARNILNTLSKEESLVPYGVEETNFDDSFSISQVRVAIDECVNRSDEYLKRFLSFPNADPTTIIVPKLCLLYSVMKHTGIKKVRAVCCIGSCGGVLTTDRFYS